MYASTLPTSNWLRRASIRLAWYRHMPASSFIVVTKQEILVISLTDFFSAASRRRNDVILLPAIRRVSGNDFVFQQDSAPAHRAALRTCSSWDNSFTNGVTLKPGVGLVRRYSKWRLSIEHVRLSIGRHCKYNSILYRLWVIWLWILWWPRNLS